MAPSLQSLEPGSLAPSSGGETQSSSLLFNLMRPPKKPLRAVRPGDGFGVGTLGTDETDSACESIIPYSFQEKIHIHNYIMSIVAREAIR